MKFDILIENILKFDVLIENILNGLARGKSLENIAKKHGVDLKSIENELSKGVSVEKEHTKSKEVAKTIAMDHLYEDPKYYTKLAKAEK
jgi:hypothetical protein